MPPTETELFRAYLDKLVPTEYEMNQPDTPTSFAEFLKDPSDPDLKRLEHKENRQINVKIVEEDSPPPQIIVADMEPSHRLPPIQKRTS